MTNKEYLLMAPQDKFDDGGASYESAVYYNISCPYREGDPDALCDSGPKFSREQCTECKMAWLEKEYR